MDGMEFTLLPGIMGSLVATMPPLVMIGMMMMGDETKSREIKCCFLIIKAIDRYDDYSKYI